ncbi:MAG: DUF6491 family protein [Pseudomonadota bacterium]
MSVHRTIFAAMTFTLAACATATAPENTQVAEAETAEPDIRQGEEVNRLCFANNISGFREATKESVILSRGTKEYLVTTFARCHDLNHAITLATQTRSGACLSRGDKLVAFDSLLPSRHGSPTFPCRIDRIYEWNEDAAEEAEAQDEDVETGDEIVTEEA